MLFYFAYQMKVVQIKLETEDYVEHKKLLKKARYHWSFYTFLLIGVLVLEIVEKMHLNKSKEEENPHYIDVLAVISTLMILTQYSFLAYLQWSMFMYFI
jgi:predicted nucleotidyltransferase